jgi:eukaryotic-like serine/threonine-protein kinase
MTGLQRGETLLLPEDARRSTSHATPLPEDLLRHSASRLRVLALVYASVFFLAGFGPELLFAHMRAHLAANPLHWVPGVAAILLALIVAALIQWRRIPLSRIAIAAIVFEVVGSYGIVAAELTDPTRIGTRGFVGFSWVAVWTLLFATVIPMRPRRAAFGALASVSSVPVGYAVLTAIGAPTAASEATPVEFFFSYVFAYLLVVGMAYVGARVVYGLGAEVQRARELGSYRLVERLGVGGMGEVWRAEHRLLARPAAIKLIQPAFTSGATNRKDAALRRFEREAQVTAQLRSPHTVNLFDFGVADDGSFYYVMELLEGLDADSLVRRFGPLPWERVIYVLRQMCHSLSEAESRGLVHRDIKPANVFLCRYGEDHDFVKILDFGIVKSANDTPEMVPTVDQMIQGTPAYIAPEQALGNEIDGRTDLYAAGCVAYWLLTGETVFTADTPIALVMHHVHTPPVPPSVRSELPIPAPFEALVLACLAKNPADRPQSAKELRERLDALTPPAPWTSDRAREWWSAHNL